MGIWQAFKVLDGFKLETFPPKFALNVVELGSAIIKRISISECNNKATQLATVAPFSLKELRVTQQSGLLGQQREIFAFR